MTASLGHNHEQLRNYVRRIEQLEQERAELTADIGEVYKQAKDAGYNTKVMREVIRIRRMDAAERAERQALMDTYMSALGMLADTPLGRAALEQQVANSPAMREATQNFIDSIPAGSSVSLKAGDRTVTVAKDKDGALIRP